MVTLTRLVADTVTADDRGPGQGVTRRRFLSYTELTVSSDAAIGAATINKRDIADSVVITDDATGTVLGDILFATGSDVVSVVTAGTQRLFDITAGSAAGIADSKDSSATTVAPNAISDAFALSEGLTEITYEVVAESYALPATDSAAGSAARGALILTDAIATVDDFSTQSAVVAESSADSAVSTADDVATLLLLARTIESLSALADEAAQALEFVRSAESTLAASDDYDLLQTGTRITIETSEAATESSRTLTLNKVRASSSDATDGTDAFTVAARTVSSSIDALPDAQHKEITAERGDEIAPDDAAIYDRSGEKVRTAESALATEDEPLVDRAGTLYVIAQDVLATDDPVAPQTVLRRLLEEVIGASDAAVGSKVLLADVLSAFDLTDTFAEVVSGSAYDDEIDATDTVLAQLYALRVLDEALDVADEFVSVFVTPELYDPLATVIGIDQPRIILGGEGI